MVVYPFKSSTQEAEAVGSLWIWDQPSLQSESQDNQDCYTEKLYLAKPKGGGGSIEKKS